MKNRVSKKLLATVLAIILLVQMMSVFSATSAVTTDWTGYTAISTKAELNNVRNNLAGKYYLTADIVFTPADFESDGAFYNNGAGWQPIGTDYFTPFTGTFDGNGHIISGLTCNFTTAPLTEVWIGLFAHNKGTIENLGMTLGNLTYHTITTSKAPIYVYAGGIVGENTWGTIRNCYNTGSVSATTDSFDYSYISIGGIVGCNFSGTISDCYNRGSISATVVGNDSSYAQAGGIAGNNSSDSTLNGCYNTGSVIANSTMTAKAGGIVGSASGTITDCYNQGSVSASTTAAYAEPFVGGIAGYFKLGIIGNCYNSGSISVTSSSSYTPFVGGIVGFTSESTITRCYNTGSVSVTASTYAYAGGIAGFNASTITNSYNTGSVSTSYSAEVGGIAGDNIGEITDCYNIGSVSSTSTACVGGIAGNNAYGEVTNCYNAGGVSTASTAYAGGIAGNNKDGTITNCYYLNNISIGVGNGPGTAISLTLDQMTQQSTFAGFDFTNTWQMNNYAPNLKGISNPVVKFDVGGGSTVASQTANYGTPIGAPTPPTRAGYIFNGWYWDATGGTKITFPYTVTEDVTLYAQWTFADIPDDINGDLVVDLKDVSTLSRYLAGWQNVTIVSTALDVLDLNKDGTADLKDVTFLSRRIAGWNT